MIKLRLFLLLLITVTLTQAQILKPLPDHLSKRILISHPTVTNIQILATLATTGLLDLDSIQLVGLYHTKEVNSYGEAQAMLDTLSSINMYLVELTDDIKPDSIYKNNALSDEFKALFSQSEGVFFFGGPDIPASLYGTKQKPQTKVSDPYRHYFELSFLYHLLGGYQDRHFDALLKQNPNYLVHGICLGMQSMNVATGGTLIQDIPSEIYKSKESEGLAHLGKNEIHRNYYKHMPEYKDSDLSGFHFHRIQFKGPFFKKRTKTHRNFKPLVNSYHHQAVKKLGKGFKVSAQSLDNRLVEAIYHKHYFNFWGIQFHPERTGFYKPKHQVRFTPNGEAKTFPEWIDQESMAFHKAYWKAINEILQKL